MNSAYVFLTGRMPRVRSVGYLYFPDLSVFFKMLLMTLEYVFDTLASFISFTALVFIGDADRFTSPSRI